MSGGNGRPTVARYRVRKDRHDGPLRRFLRGVGGNSPDRNVSDIWWPSTVGKPQKSRIVTFADRAISRREPISGADHRLAAWRASRAWYWRSREAERLAPASDRPRRKVSPHQRAQPAAFGAPAMPVRLTAEQLDACSSRRAPLAADRRQPGGGAEMWDRSNCFRAARR